MKITCTICSRSKLENEKPLAAEERYTGAHIQEAKKIAENLKTPFYILSGKYGIIPGRVKIPYYDYYLEEDNIDKLAEKVGNQIREQKISEIDFYLENKPSWVPYAKVLRKAATQTQIILHIRYFSK